MALSGRSLNNKISCYTTLQINYLQAVWLPFKSIVKEKRIPGFNSDILHTVRAQFDSALFKPL